MSNRFYCSKCLNFTVLNFFPYSYTGNADFNELLWIFPNTHKSTGNSNKPQCTLNNYQKFTNIVLFLICLYLHLS